MIKNKRALVWMLESIIAIIILLGFFIFVMSKQREKPNIADEIYNLERTILTEVSDNTTLRDAVLLSDKASVEYFIANRLSAHPALNFSIAICNPPGEECVLSPRPVADIYVDDIIIANITQPKVLRLFIWIGVARKVAAPPAGCGNGVLDAGEQCDNGTKNGGVCTAPYGGSCTYCSLTCTIVTVEGPYCGDGVVNGPEECEAGQTSVCWTYVGPITYCKANAQQDGPVSAECIFKSENPKSICVKGTKSCITSTCAWGTCGGEVWPEEENSLGACTDGVDNDCNTMADIDEPECAPFY